MMSSRQNVIKVHSSDNESSQRANARAKEQRNKKRKATVIDNFFGKKRGRKSKFELEIRKRKTASETKTMTNTITNPDGTVETTTETV
eukprot:4187427-Ditylum_brightwellii.AAC.1